jgi:hypothetical protein
MYYEERVINGALHCRTKLDGEWTPISAEALTNKIARLKKSNQAMESVLTKIADALGTPQGDVFSLGEALANLTRCKSA